MSGQEFEDAMIEALREWIDDEGVVLRRRQSMSFRAGKFEGGQEADIFVDSPRNQYYLGFEVKSRKKSGRGLYFSRDYSPEQFKKQMKYGTKSGREMFVLIEIRGDDSREAYLTFPELFERRYENGDKKVTWEDIKECGKKIGEDGDYKLSNDVVWKARDLKSQKFRDLV